MVKSSSNLLGTDIFEKTPPHRSPKKRFEYSVKMRIIVNIKKMDVRIFIFVFFCFFMMMVMLRGEWERAPRIFWERILKKTPPHRETVEYRVKCEINVCVHHHCSS